VCPKRVTVAEWKPVARWTKNLDLSTGLTKLAQVGTSIPVRSDVMSPHQLKDIRRTTTTHSF
jgi:hypothetical protein